VEGVVDHQEAEVDLVVDHQVVQEDHPEEVEEVPVAVDRQEVVPD